MSLSMPSIAFSAATCSGALASSATTICTRLRRVVRRTLATASATNFGSP
jgi:hypothetical protein